MLVIHGTFSSGTCALHKYSFATRRSFSDFDGCIYRYGIPDLVHLAMHYGDASVGPVEALHNERQSAQSVSLTRDGARRARLALPGFEDMLDQVRGNNLTIAH